ncbi:serine hydrolase domain-containing protein [Rhodothalassium salexigens]|uniref:serine hydrolase domain-containing protein n=1 Tax=Rhodothalassium salexigens TaxID=1086 RepID=UPI0014045549|nr:serine hydrolase domain-containing protein [Rhodothalassium salexigens]MBB4212493.1 beta-lactamase class C [Rhodothalassium salexigens DSM 2132]
MTAARRRDTVRPMIAAIRPVLVSLCLVLTLAPRPALALHEDDLAALRARIDALMRRDDMVGLAVGIVAGGEVILAETRGTRVRGGDAAVRPDTRFRLASLSKGFAGTLAAQLVEAGKLDLTQPVARDAPYFRLADQRERDRATLEHVLSHRLGLPPHAYDNLLEADVPVTNIFKRLGGVKLVCRVGDCYVYQNVAFSLIEPAVARATGGDYEAVVTRRLFEPLAMRHASFGLDALKADANWAHPHVGTRRGLAEVTPEPAYYRVPSAGGINASLDDMLAWLKAQMGLSPEVLSDAVLEEAHRPRVASRHETRRARWLRGRVTQTHYALGWRVYDYRDLTMIYHAGGVDGYSAQIAFMPDQDLGYVALWNSNSCKGWTLMPDLFDRHLDQPVDDWSHIRC